jgi:hypothetical protein
MAIIKLLNDEVLDVKEDGQRVAADTQRSGRMVRLTDAGDGETAVWVNSSAIASFTDSPGVDSGSGGLSMVI